MDFVNPGLPFADGLGLVLPSPVSSADELSFGDVHARTVHARLGAEPGDVRVAHGSSGILERVEDLPAVVVEDQERALGDAVALVPFPEEKEALIGALDLQAVEAGEGGVGPEVPVALPDPVRVGGGDLPDERDDGALEMERDLHVEVAHAAEHGDHPREPAAPLAPGGPVVVLEQDGRDLGVPPAQRLLERVPPRGVLERRVGAGVGEGAGGGGVGAADGEVERGLAEGDVAAVDGGGDAVGEGLLGEGLGLGVDEPRVGEAGEGGQEAGEGLVVPEGDRVVEWAVRVVPGLDGRRRRRRRRRRRGGGRRRLRHLKAATEEEEEENVAAVANGSGDLRERGREREGGGEERGGAGNVIGEGGAVSSFRWRPVCGNSGGDGDGDGDANLARL